MKISAISVCLIVMMMFVGGCASQPSRLEMDYGTSYNLQKFNQILNAEAEKNLEPVVGMNGEVAQAVVDNHKKSFQKQTITTKTYNFSIGQ